MSGQILACKWVKLACQRHLNDLIASKNAEYPYRFDQEKANRVCEFIEGLPHVKDGGNASAGELIKLQPWQAFVLACIFGWVKRLNGYRRFRTAYICIPRKNGKALAINTDILTPSGWKTMGDLQVGDAVYGPDGKPRRIVAATEVMHNRPCYAVEFSDGETIIADAQHQWLTDSRRDRDRLKGKGGKTAGPKPTIKTTEEIASSVWCRREANHRIPIATAVDKLKRKATRQRALAIRSGHRQIVRCEPVESVPVRCIQVAAEDGLFLAGRSLVTTHNSLLGAGVGLYMFCAAGDFGAEVYSGATTEKQAWEVFRPAKLIAQRTPELQEAFGIDVNAKGMVILSNGSRFEPVVGKPGDGASPSCAIIDEYHEHDTDELFDTMQTGMGARREPLMFVITTAGSNIAGPCHALQSNLQKVLDGSIEQDELFGIIFSIDESDNWTTEEALRKANPNYGVSVFPEYLQLQQATAIRDSGKQNVVKTKHFNLWVNAKTAWMNMQRWHALADPSLRAEEFRGLPCYAAVDLSSKLDITARVKIFRKVVNGKEHYYLFGAFYLPEDRASEPELQHYQKWVHDRHLLTTPGNVLDYEAIADDTIADIKAHRILELGFDPWNAEQFAQKVAAATPVKAIEIPQQVRHMSDPMKQFEALVVDGRIHHDGNPVLNWMMSNVVAKIDAKENIFPNKERPEGKIDGAVAAIMALSRAMLAKPGGSIYSQRGLLTL